MPDDGRRRSARRQPRAVSARAVAATLVIAVVGGVWASLRWGGRQSWVVAAPVVLAGAMGREHEPVAVAAQPHVAAAVTRPAERGAPHLAPRSARASSPVHSARSRLAMRAPSGFVRHYSTPLKGELMNLLKKAGIATVTLAAAAVSVIVGVAGRPADTGARSGDAVGVGSDTLQNGADFAFDGAPGVAGGYNNIGNINRVMNVDATGDANGRAVYDGTCGTADSTPAWLSSAIPPRTRRRTCSAAASCCAPAPSRSSGRTGPAPGIGALISDCQHRLQGSAESGRSSSPAARGCRTRPKRATARPRTLPAAVCTCTRSRPTTSASPE